jgi:Protein of unknown function (DUF642)
VPPSQSTNCPAASGGTGVLSDGDFSQAPDPGSWQGIKAGTKFAPYWTVSQRTIDFYGPTNAWPVPGGLCSVDLDGSGPQGVGGIAHSPTDTTPGATYTVGFLFSGNRHCARYQHGPRIKTLLVEAASLRETQATLFYWDTAHGHDANHGFFANETWSFTAVDRRTQFVFTSLDRPITSNCGPVVAAISVTENTSESLR